MTKPTDAPLGGPAAPEPPEGLESEAQAVWRETIAQHVIDPGALPVLEDYCAQITRQRALERAYAEYRTAYPDDVREHALFEKRIRDAARAARNAASKLGLIGRKKRGKAGDTLRDTTVPPWCYVDSAGRMRSWPDDRTAKAEPADPMPFFTAVRELEAAGVPYPVSHQHGTVWAKMQELAKQ